MDSGRQVTEEELAAEGAEEGPAPSRRPSPRRSPSRTSRPTTAPARGARRRGSRCRGSPLPRPAGRSGHRARGRGSRGPTTAAEEPVASQRPQPRRRPPPRWRRADEETKKNHERLQGEPRRRRALRERSGTSPHARRAHYKSSPPRATPTRRSRRFARPASPRPRSSPGARPPRARSACIHPGGQKGVLVEVRCNTDFVTGARRCPSSSRNLLLQDVLVRQHPLGAGRGTCRTRPATPSWPSSASRPPGGQVGADHRRQGPAAQVGELPARAAVLPRRSG